ncbi:hypothetical protein Tco_1530823 [Tanacetum coccineum]
MTSLGTRYEHLKKIPEELGIQSALPAPEHAQSQSSGRKKSIWNWSLKSKFLDWSRMNDMHKVNIETLLTYLVMDSNITTPENTRFCLKLRNMIAEHPNQEKLKSKKVKLELVGYKLD